MNRRMFWLPLAALAMVTSSVPNVAEPQQGGMDALGWMTGHWCGASAEQRFEELWLASDNVLLGLGRTLKGERTVAFEYLRIAPVESVPTYIAQPNGRPPTMFKRTAGGTDWVRFENPSHDFPQRIEYRRNGDALRAEIAGPDEGGKEKKIAYEFTRCGAQ